MRYVAGLDGGGTKTAVTVADERGAVAGTFVAGPINFNGQDEESIRGTFREIMETIGQASGGLNRCAQICIGAAGVSNPEVSDRLAKLVRESGYAGGLRIVGDHETALYGALERPYGIILIAGTGSICFGRNEAGLIHRTGGFGYLIDDEGSGYSIGRDLLAAVVRASDGRSGPTAITELVFGQLGVGSVPEIIGFVYDKRTNKKDVAALAPLLSAACDAGDRVAIGIADKSARSLYDLAVPAVEKLSLWEGELAMAGSVLLRNSYVQGALSGMLKQTYPKLQVGPARKDAVSGAVLMALDRLKEEQGG